jgi:O-6-methylguanine DNA methyltransferase
MWYDNPARRISHQEERTMAVVVASSRKNRPLARITHRPVGLLSTQHMAMIPTAWGLCGIVWQNHDDENAAGFAHRPSALLCRIYTPGAAPAVLRRTILRSFAGCTELFPDAHGRFHPETVPDWFSEMAHFLQGYYTAALRHQTEPQYIDQWAFWRSRLDWSQVTPFQRQVLEAAACIPCSRTLTYGQVAAQIGKPAAVRAVGAALGANPWPVLIPCHRVMGAAGKLTGFSAPGGIRTKRRMLELEQARLESRL